MADHVQFPAYRVEQHALTVDDVHNAMQTARSAVHEVTMDNGAYGQLCQFLPGILSGVFGAGLDAMYQTVDVLQETATNLRTTAREMSATDAGSDKRITHAGGPRMELPL